MKSKINNKDIFTNDITDQREIEDKLNKLKTNNYKEYLEFLVQYYLLLPPNICQKHNILKKKTEEETFFQIIRDLIEKFGNEEKNEKDENVNESLKIYVKKFLESPASEELKNLNLEIIPSRWDYIYTKFTKFEIETNPELIYYNLSNDLLNNIKNNKTPVEIIYFLKAFLHIFNAYVFKNKMLINTKKFLLLLLSNCEYRDDKNSNEIFYYLEILNDFTDEILVEKSIIRQLDPKNIFEGLLIEIIIRYSMSLLAKSSFQKIFKFKNIPSGIEKEIFNNNIKKYIYFLNFTSYDNTGRTLKRYPMVLMNVIKDKKIFNLNNPPLDKLLKKFVNIVVRKFIFGHELPHLSGCLLYYSQSINKINTPPHKIIKGELEYDKNNEKEKGERGEIFEILAYGKVKKIFNLFDLLFIADERNDNLTIDEHCRKYKDYCLRKKELSTILADFPKDQILSNLVNSIHKLLLNDKKSYTILSTVSIAYKKDNDGVDDNDYHLLENLDNLVSLEVCPLSKSKPNYRDKNNIYGLNNY